MSEEGTQLCEHSTLEFLTYVFYFLLFAAGSYVALTLLGRPPGHHQHPLEPPPQPQYTPPAPTTPSTPTSRISGPHAVDVSYVFMNYVEFFRF